MKKRIEVDLKETWKIEDMYANDAIFYEEIENVKKKALDFSNKYKKIDSKEKLYDSIKEYSDISGLMNDLDTFAGISMEVDTTDESMAKRYAKFSDEASDISGILSMSLIFLDLARIC